MPTKITITVSAASILGLAALALGASSWANQIEARVAVVEAHNKILITRLDRIENKLDRVIEQR